MPCMNKLLRASKLEKIKAAWEAGMKVEDIMTFVVCSRHFIYCAKEELGLLDRWEKPLSDDRPNERRCSHCKTWRSIDAFRKDKHRKGGLAAYCGECSHKQAVTRRQNHSAHYLWKSTKRSAQERGLTHTIAPEDIVIPDTCPVLGIPLFFGNGRSPNSPSVDRLDNSRGYEPGNILVVSFRANVLRGDATSEELLKLVAFYATPSGSS